MMKRTPFMVTALAVAMLTLTGCNKDGDNKAGTSNISDASPEMDKISYILGHDAGKNLKEMDAEINPKVIASALADGFAGKDSKFTEEQSHKIFDEYQKRKQEETIKKVEEEAKKNKEDGDKFLAENKSKEGVQTTASGLQYKAISEGTGAKPKATDTVVVNYEGKTIDGKVFDSSYERGEPAVFDLNHMIAGFKEGVQLMPAGSKYEFYIPSELAYGKESMPGIGPNSVLTFTVELLDEESAKKAQADAKAKAEAQMAEMMKQMEAQAQAEAKK